MYERMPEMAILQPKPSNNNMPPQSNKTTTVYP